MEIQNVSKEKVHRHNEHKKDTSYMKNTASYYNNNKNHWEQLETSNTGRTGDRHAKQNSNSFLAATTAVRDAFT